MTIDGSDANAAAIKRYNEEQGTNIIIRQMKYFNWLRVLGTAELAQIDQRVCQQLHAIMPLLDTFKSEQEPLELIFPRKGPLDPHA